MNFLPFIYFLLITIAILNYSFFEKHILCQKTYKIATQQYLEKTKDFNKDIAIAKFNKLIAPKKSKDKTAAKTTLKINFLPLLQEDKEQQKELFKIFVRLLNTLMQDRISTIKNPEMLAEAIIKAAKKNPNAPLETLNLENENIQFAFYQILKEEPALSKFATFSQKYSAKKINFNKASPQVLSALFPEKIAEIIIKNKNNIKNRNSLKNLLVINGFQEDFPFKFLSFEEEAK